MKRRLLPAVLIVALAALVTGAALVWHGVLTRPGTSAQREAAVASARTAVTAVMTYDYRHLDRDIASTSRLLGGSFRGQYLTAMNDEVKPRAPQEKTVVTGQVVQVAVEAFDSSGTQATLLVFGQQSVTNAVHASPTLNPTQLEAVVEIVGGQWRLVQLTQLG